MNLPWDFWFWWIPVLFIGSCVGSFLNVVIYRVPLGMSVNEPKRSFCPGCQKDIPWQRNLPLLTWLLQRGRCAECKMKIPARYFWVELLTTVLWAVAWWLFGRQGLPGEAFLLVVLISLLVAISFIDGEHYIIPVGMTWVGAGVGILGAIVFPLSATHLCSSLSGWENWRLASK